MYFLCYFCCEKKLDYSSVECRVSSVECRVSSDCIAGYGCVKPLFGTKDF